MEHFLIKSIPKGKKLRILDVGGGTGRFTKPLLRLGNEVVLSDLSAGMLKKAKSSLSNFSGISFIKESATNMQAQKNNSFDAVIMMNAILDYCGDYDKAIKEAKRVLKPKGIFLGTVNNRLIYCKNHELKTEQYRLFEKNMQKGDRYIIWGDQKKGHISHEFTLQEIKASLEANKLIIRKILGVFNLIDKYSADSLKNKEEMIKLQIKYAEKEEYINNSSDFFFIAQKP